jgi:hypothetical protein
MSTQDAGTLVSASDLVTVSDYFSFVGADEQGHVAFAIDNNRGRDGSAYQAEHFYAVLHDEHHGWMKVSGIGRYENTNHELRPIPDSSFFQFVGQPATGLTITSPVNQLALRLASIPERLALSDDETIFSMGSAAAQLTWKERVIPGRVIYGYLVKKNFNLMTRRSLKGLGAFQGLYLLAGMASDLYIQHSLMKLTVAGTPPLLGFWCLADSQSSLTSCASRSQSMHSPLEPTAGPPCGTSAGSERFQEQNRKQCKQQAPEQCC